VNIAWEKSALVPKFVVRGKKANGCQLLQIQEKFLHNGRHFTKESQCLKKLKQG